MPVFTDRFPDLVRRLFQLAAQFLFILIKEESLVHIFFYVSIYCCIEHDKKGFAPPCFLFDPYPQFLLIRTSSHPPLMPNIRAKIETQILQPLYQDILYDLFTHEALIYLSRCHGRLPVIAILPPFTRNILPMLFYQRHILFSQRCSPSLLTALADRSQKVVLFIRKRAVGNLYRSPLQNPFATDSTEDNIAVHGRQF